MTTRSPAYPAASLPEAVEAIGAIYKTHQRKTITDAEVVAAMGYKGLSGASRSKMSALKKYGLIERQSNGWRLSNRAIQIILKPVGSPDRNTAISDAVSDVDLFQQLVKSHRTASESALAMHLEADLRFTREGAKAAAQSFLETIRLLEPRDGDTLDAGIQDDRNGSAPAYAPIEAPPMVANHTTPAPADTLPLPLMRDDGGFQMVHIPRNLSPAEFSFLKQLLETYKPAILARQSSPEAE